jgi:SAM-dependent methyltransferase
MSETAASFWDELYGRRERMWSGNPNAQLVRFVEPLEPGTVLDLGCGEGGDAIWLARRGWQVTAADVSATAIERAEQHAAESGVTVEFRRVDLAHDFPAGPFDLVSAQFLQSPLEFPREQVLRAAAAAVGPGGHLLVVEHGAMPPWAQHAHHHELPPPEELLEVVPPGDEWEVEFSGALERDATGPDGQAATLVDNVLLLRRL